MTWRAGGVRTWVTQRVSAVFMLVYITLFFVALLSAAPLSYDQWLSWFRNPLVNVATIMFWLALMLHAWIGARDVIMDYADNAALRFTALSFAAIYLIAMTIWISRILILVMI